MQIAAGTRLGPYEILAPIGAGGMGEVYRGRDTRLDRAVAIKVLPSHLSSSPELRERFDREARAISRVSHPNICTLFDVGHHDGVDFLVMELLEGETLADRLARGPLPLREVLRYGAEIAGALERAHREGLVHRDLKPGNVMLTRGGAKVLDFGLVKAEDPAAGGSETVQKPLTGAGSVVGTLHYMAPEQIEGKPADARTDIFALGIVLYEMATGRRPFDGTSRTTLIAAILEHDPEPLSELQPLTPPALERVVQTCLAKDPEERWQTAHDVRLQLQSISASGVTAVARAARSRRPSLREITAWIIAAAAIGAAAFLALRADRAGKPEPAFLSIVPPEDDILPEMIGVAISPDGRAIVYTAPTASADSMLWLRPLGAATATPIAGTEDAMHPFWSPDSRFIAFFAHGKLKKVPAAGGMVERIADAPAGRGGTWGSSDVIVFAPTLRGPLLRVSASGGATEPVVTTTGGGTRRWPWFLPDGRTFLFLAAGPAIRSGIYAGTIEGSEPKFVTAATMQAFYAEPGYLLTFRDGAIVAQEFDAKSLQLRGQPKALAAGVAAAQGYNLADFSVSRTGVIAMKESDLGSTQLTWFDRRGAVLGTVGQPGTLLSMRLSPRADRVLVVRADPAMRSGDVWIEEVGRLAAQRITFRDRQARGVAWSPDQREVVFGISAAQGPLDVVRKPLTEPGEEQPVVSSPSLEVPNDWSPDGRHILVQQVREETRFDLILASPDGKNERVWLATPFDEVMARFSPDGKWVAYSSNETGRHEVYVRPFPGPGTATRVSVGGGVMPAWRHDGREIFFLSPRFELMAASVTAGATLTFGEPVNLFATPAVRLFTEVQTFDPAPDGQRFLINARTGRQPPRKINLLINWTRALD
ncbi:MAG TPA: protein kinase [Thermoanaerobaculia bacterium]|nr:protein kinase [Thermoanaerobaculia bacterium]